VVVEVERFLLGMDVGGKKDGLGVELGYEHNIGHEYNGEEVLPIEVECLHVELHHS
jgi:hypothetical protein